MYFLSEFGCMKIKIFKMIINKDLYFIIWVFTFLKKNLKEKKVNNKGIRLNKLKKIEKDGQISQNTLIEVEIEKESNVVRGSERISCLINRIGNESIIWEKSKTLAWKIVTIEVQKDAIRVSLA